MKLKLAATSVLIGVLVALVFKGFEWLVNNGTNYIWNDIFHTDQTRWIVVPLAIVLSIIYSLIVRWLKQQRVVKIETDLMGELAGMKETSLSAIGIIFVLGLTSLWAGGSLGPEASLVGLSAGLGLYLAIKLGLGGDKQLLVLASVGALLVAFFGSIIPIIIPLLISFQRSKRVVLGEWIPTIITGLSAYGAIYLMDHRVSGYGSFAVTATSQQLHDFPMAFLLGAAGALVALLLKFLIKWLRRPVEHIDTSWPWYVSASIFGGVIGLLYLFGGQTVEFTGSEGSKLLAGNHAGYGALFLLGLILIKILVTSWSLNVGYRGGLVFPSIYTGVALGLLALSLLSGVAGPGLDVGSIGGVVVGMTSPLLGGVILLSLLPFKYLGLIIAAVAGATLATKVAGRLMAPKEA